MSQIEYIREHLRRLLRECPTVHMDVTLKSPKLSLQNAEATLTGVYPHLFQIEECVNGIAKRHTISYRDVIVKNIVIHELDLSLF